MNFNRFSIKTKAKKILRKNWGWAIVVTFILSLTTPTISSSFVRDEVQDFFRPNVQNSQQVEENSNGDIIIHNSEGLNKYRPDIIVKEYMEEVEAAVREVFPGFQGNIWPIIGMGLLIAALLAIALKIFVLNPINVGCCKWYLRNRTEDKPKLRAIVEVFTHGYIRIVGIMLVRDIFLFLWFLLLIVPGIIKSYEYISHQHYPYYSNIAMCKHFHYCT